jgi:Aegerolysin
MEHKYYIHYTITNRTGGKIFLKNIKIQYGNYYQIHHKDKDEKWNDTIQIKNNCGFDLLCYGIMESLDNINGPFNPLVSKVFKTPNITKGSFELFCSSNEKIAHIAWNCSNKHKYNTYELYYINKDFIVQQTGGNKYSGPIGNVNIIVARLPILCNLV